MQTNIFLAVATIAMLCPPLYSQIEGAEIFILLPHLHIELESI